MSKWKQGIAFLTPSYIESAVKGESYRFYPVPVSLVFSLKKLVEPLAGSLTVLFENTTTDTSATEKKITNKDTDGEQDIQEWSKEAISPETLTLRLENRKKAVTDITRVFFDNQDLVGNVIMGSIKDLFEGNSKPPVSEFMESVTVDVFWELCAGVFEANRKILGPFSDTFIQMMNMKVQEMKNMTEEPKEEEPKEEEKGVAPVLTES